MPHVGDEPHPRVELKPVAAQALQRALDAVARRLLDERCGSDLNAIRTTARSD